jgi:hypothetical protein
MSIKALTFGFALAIATATPSAWGQTRPESENTCSDQNNECLLLCSRLISGTARRCQSDCADRQQSCLNTGIYEWDEKPPATNLIPR